MAMISRAAKRRMRWRPVISTSMPWSTRRCTSRFAPRVVTPMPSDHIRDRNDWLLEQKLDEIAARSLTSCSRMPSPDTAPADQASRRSLGWLRSPAPTTPCRKKSIHGIQAPDRLTSHADDPVRRRLMTLEVSAEVEQRLRQHLPQLQRDQQPAHTPIAIHEWVDGLELVMERGSSWMRNGRSSRRSPQNRSRSLSAVVHFLYRRRHEPRRRRRVAGDADQVLNMPELTEASLLAANAFHEARHAPRGSAQRNWKPSPAPKHQVRAPRLSLHGSTSSALALGGEISNFSSSSRSAS